MMTERAVAIFDLDRTISRQDLYLAFLIQGVRQPANLGSACLLPAHLVRFFAHVINNDQLKSLFLASIYGGRSRDFMDEAAARFIKTVRRTMLKSAALRRVAEHRRQGHFLLLASASLDIYTVPLAGELGFDDVVATKVAWSTDGRITGQLDGPNLRGTAKAAAVARILRRHGLDASPTFFYSDHESDAPLFSAARWPGAVDPTKKLRMLAREFGWPVYDWRGFDEGQA
ncbi:HAD family hydrolase [Rhizobium sp. A22-96]